MPFDKETKARMFIKSARICCLCFKQCGTNIEAAHIVDEAKGGSNDEENGIPLCFDCHQESRAYDPKHPKGNIFTSEELKARRDRVYSLVETGALQAQVIANRVHGEAKGEIPTRFSFIPVKPAREAKAVLKYARTWSAPLDSLALKLKLLNENDKAYVLDGLVESFSEGSSLEALMSILSYSTLEIGKATLILEELIRKITLVGNTPAKKVFLYSVKWGLGSDQAKCWIFNRKASKMRPILTLEGSF